jgi:cephalosporin hydroxylase
VNSYYCHCSSERGKNPKTAVAEFLKTNSDFVGDQVIDEKLLVYVASG